MLINNQDVLNTLLRNFALIKTKLNMKISKIKNLYKLKEKNVSRIKL